MREKIDCILCGISDVYKSYEGTDLFQDNILDSFDIMNVVAELEETYGFEIDANDVVAENFKTIDTIVDMVKKYVGTEE